jgi:hypothetical protein
MDHLHITDHPMNYLYFIVSDTDSDEEREESSEVKPSAVSVLAAGAEIK